MIRDLLDASRLRAGQPISLNLDDCDLGLLAREVVEALASLHGNRFVLQTDPIVRGRWSTDELHRALWNLATNAVKYGAPDRPITISVRQTAAGATLSVHNDGAPIPIDQQERLFQPYARGLSLRAGSAAGWGLGLTLVRGCAEAHGGSIQLHSAPGIGTTFTVHLPADAGPHQAGTHAH